MYALGDYQDVKLSEPRQLCEGARKLVKQGISPANQRQIDRIRQFSEAKNTFELVSKEWLQTKDWQTITKQRRLDVMNRVVFPKIRAMPPRLLSREPEAQYSFFATPRGMMPGTLGYRNQNILKIASQFQAKNQIPRMDSLLTRMQDRS